MDLDHLLYGSFGAVQAAMKQVGTDVVLGSGADSITFKSVALASLVASDFVFH